MKIESIIKLLPTVILLAIISQSTIVSAHSRIFQQLGSSVSAVDVYRINCPAPAVRLEIALKDRAGGASFISAITSKGNASISYTDPEGGDQLPQEFTPGAPSLAQSSGNYTVFVNHTRAGSEFYDLYWHCREADNGELNGQGESITVIQNQ